MKEKREASTPSKQMTSTAFSRNHNSYNGDSGDSGYNGHNGHNGYNGYKPAEVEVGEVGERDGQQHGLLLLRQALQDVRLHLLELC